MGSGFAKDRVGPCAADAVSGSAGGAASGGVAFPLGKVVFGKRIGKSYAVTFYDKKGVQQTWAGEHGGPHVETPFEASRIISNPLS